MLAQTAKDKPLSAKINIKVRGTINKGCPESRDLDRV